MSESVNISDNAKGADVVYRKFVDLYNTELSEAKKNRPNQYISTVAEWAPAILYYFDESVNANLSIHVLQDVLNEAQGDSTKSKAVVDGLHNASLRVNKKEFSEKSYEYYKYFFESRQIIYEDKKEEIFYIGNDAPLAIWNYDGSLQAENALGIVKKTIKQVENDDKMLESFVYGFLIKTLVVEDYPEFDRWLRRQD